MLNTNLKILKNSHKHHYQDPIHKQNITTIRLLL